MQKIIVLGATSEIAQQVQRIWASQHKELLLVARSAARLAAVSADLRARGANQVIEYVADLTDSGVYSELMAFVSSHLPDFDGVLLAYGSMQVQEKCMHSVELSRREWEINFVSQASLLTLFANVLEQRKRGCIAAITSVAGDRGRNSNYVYGSAKAAMNTFLQGLRGRLYRSNVRVVTIKPGPVKTPMTSGLTENRLFADATQIAEDICQAVEGRTNEIIYTPGYWRYVMAALKIVPEAAFKRFSI